MTGKIFLFFELDPDGLGKLPYRHQGDEGNDIVVARRVPLLGEFELIFYLLKTRPL
jgi:hypothetical protein